MIMIRIMEKAFTKQKFYIFGSGIAKVYIFRYMVNNVIYKTKCIVVCYHIN